MNKTKNTIIALIGLALIIGGVLVFKQSNTIPKGWELYENEEFGFSFQYPKEFILDDNLPSIYFSPSALTLKIRDKGDNESVYFDLTMSVLKPPINEIDKKWIYKNIKSEKIFNSNTFGLSYHNNHPIAAVTEKNDIIFIFNRSFVYGYKGDVPEEETQKNNTIFLNILDTFKIKSL